MSAKKSHLKSNALTKAIFEASDHDLEWDNSTEQFQLMDHANVSDEEEDLFEQIMQTTPLYNTDDEDRRQPKLKRSNAIRRKHHPLTRSSSTSSLEQTNANVIQRAIASTPTSPSKVILNQVNNLNLVLKPNVPIVPDAVQLNNQVQMLNQALDHTLDTTVRRSARILEQGGQIDYRQMNEDGQKHRRRNIEGGHAE